MTNSKLHGLRHFASVLNANRPSSLKKFWAAVILHLPNHAEVIHANWEDNTHHVLTKTVNLVNFYLHSRIPTYDGRLSYSFGTRSAS